MSQASPFLMQGAAVKDSAEFVLELKNIRKEYYGNRVLKGVSLSVRPGEIHGIVGENGAGKSTLMNILFGMPVIHSTGGYEGEILFDGKPVQIKSPFEAMAMGIGMVHQEFMLIPGYTVTENIKLNREITRPNLLSRIFGPRLQTLDMPAMGRDARKALDQLEIGLDEWTKVAGIPVGYMQFVEIAREIDKTNVRLLVFDEPTAVLNESEAEIFLAALKKLSGLGIGILFISHRLHEIIGVCENITVLRDGSLVAEKKSTETSVEELARLMIGHTLGDSGMRKKAAGSGENILEIRNLQVAMPGEQVKDASLDVVEGEILGIGGLAGQGKIGIANGIMGLYPATGTVRFKGKELPLGNTKAILQEGIAFLSEDRRGVGLLLDMSIEMNIASTAMQALHMFLRKIGPFDQIDEKAIRNAAIEHIQKLDIRCTGPTQPVRRLSGGNQQKVCIAKALALDPCLLFVSEPTRGIDVGAKKLVLDTLVALRETHGMTIVITSSELAELRSICDRIAIVSEGKVIGILPPDADDAEFGLMMAGEHGRNQQ